MLSDLVGADHESSYAEFDFETHIVSHAADHQAVAIPDDIDTAHWALCAFNPLREKSIGQATKALAISDFESPREQRRNPYIQEVLRPVGIAHELKVFLPRARRHLPWLCLRTRPGSRLQPARPGRAPAPSTASGTPQAALGANHRARLSDRPRTPDHSPRRDRHGTGEIADQLVVSVGTVKDTPRQHLRQTRRPHPHRRRRSRTHPSRRHTERWPHPARSSTSRIIRRLRQFSGMSPGRASLRRRSDLEQFVGRWIILVLGLAAPLHTNLLHRAQRRFVVDRRKRDEPI